jgi:hypothetical protein
MKKLKRWLKENGIVGFLSFGVALVALILGVFWVFWLSLGIFIEKNREILKRLWKEEVVEKIKK